MTFIWPVMLLSLVLVPLLVMLYLRIQQRRTRSLRGNMARYGSLTFGQNMPGGGPGMRRHIPPALFLLSITVLLVSLARPQATVRLPKVEGTVILAFDVSGSMSADDFKPTRIEAAKAAARDFIDKQPSTVSIGVVAFSDNGFSVQAPTNDQGQILAAINRLTPQRGTSLANGIQASLKVIQTNLDQVSAPAGNFEGEPSHLTNLTSEPTPSPTPMPKGTYIPATIVLLSDGENNENPDPMAAAQTAADRGVRIYTVGIGSPQGVNLHVNGFTVNTKLDEAMLQNIAETTGGVYYNAQNEKDLLKIYDTLDPQLLIKPQKTEVTALFAGAGILIFLVGSVFSMVWFTRLL